MDLAHRLQTWRAHLGLTLLVVARRAGLGHPLLSKIENGHSNVRLVKLTDIVTKGLRMHMSAFFGPLPKARKRAMKPSAGARA